MEKLNTFTVGFLPWLKVDKQYEVGKALFWPYKDKRNTYIKDKTVRKQLERMFSSYVDENGNSVDDLTIISLKNNYLNLRVPEDIDYLWNAIYIFAFAPISKINYFDCVRFGASYLNTSNFDTYFQKFGIGSDYISLTYRRKFGQTLNGGYLFTETKTPMPIEADSNRLAREIDINLLSALGKVLDGDKPGYLRILLSLEWFFRANTDSSKLSLDSEAVMMATAFEILFELMDESNKKDKFRKKLNNLLPQVKKIKLRDVKNQKQDWFVKEHWVDRFYWWRSKIVHGGRVDPKKLKWTRVIHLLMANIIFICSIKYKLREYGLYYLSERDERQAESIDEILEALIGFSKNKQWSILDRIQKIERNLAFKKATNRALEMLKELPDEK